MLAECQAGDNLQKVQRKKLLYGELSVFGGVGTALLRAGGRQVVHEEAMFCCSTQHGGMSCRQTSSSQSRSEGTSCSRRELRAITHCSGEISVCILTGSRISMNSFSQAEQIFVCLEEGATGD